MLSFCTLTPGFQRLPDELPLLTLVWCGLALLCGGLIKGTLGVGTPLLTVPLMALVLPPQIAVTLMAIPVVVANLWQILHAPNLWNTLSRFWPAATALVLFTGIGTSILSTIDEQLLLLVVGVSVIGFSLLQVLSTRPWLSEGVRIPAGLFFGSLSGLIGGISSMFGPMLVIYLVSLRGLEKNDFVAAISFLYVCAVVPWTISLILIGLLDETMIVASTLATVPVVVGLLLGQQIRKHIGNQRFHQLIILILLCSGCSMLLQSFGLPGI